MAFKKVFNPINILGFLWGFRTTPLFLFSFFLAGCGENHTLAPVVEITWQARTAHSGKHVVQPGETLYAIAFRYDKDFRQLAVYNHLSSPYALSVGQIIRLPRSALKLPSTQRLKAKPLLPRRFLHASPLNRWLWPAEGRVVAYFIPATGKKGIDIAGKKGNLVRAAKEGVIAYAGSGLAGYGNLIIIKHEGQFLTAYGNNLKNRVKEGQRVKAGQIIADMGIVDRKFWGVHFEIRKAGQPVNPLYYLKLK